MDTVAQSDDRPLILVVDDAHENLRVLGELLRRDFRVRVANSGARALEVAALDPMPALILLDIMMPEMDGYAVLQALKQSPRTHDIPVIFVTALDADDEEERGLAMGAVDYVTKPYKPALLMARIRSQLELKRARDRLSDQNAFLDGEVRRRTAENELVKDVTLMALAALAEKRDNETGNHLRRTQAYVALLAEQLKTHPRFAASLQDREQRERLAKCAPLHDIGKVGIPDHILLKPGKLEPDEWAIMKTHAALGAEALREAIGRVRFARSEAELTPSERLTEPFAFLETAALMAESHHERWDGTGYPKGLKGEAIPLPGRLMAMADVFDALISRRPYKVPMPLEQAVELIRGERGRHFDPDVVDAFLALVPQLAEVARRFDDAAVVGEP
ncbi:two-component system response regulator [uncultured Aquabacterium sp.]|uniref:response regulator n=1 Tax=Aquabacterium sp. TaxID=1872578 RepID=UPI0025E056AA|nr:two-component system response regulator [uncultured Aquabacterium sp.]